MLTIRSLTSLAGALTFATAVALCSLLPARSLASDHVDAPLVAQDRGADIGDLYAFLDPNDNTKVVLIMSTQGFIVSGEHFGMGTFDPTLRYRFAIENTGDAADDTFVDVYYARTPGPLLYQNVTVVLPDASRLYARTTSVSQDYKPNPPTIWKDPQGRVSFFAGVMDDPFFSDSTGVNRFVASSILQPGHPDRSLLGMRQGRNTYAGFNTLITAIELPTSLLRGKGDIIGISAQTQRRQNQALLTDGEIVSTGGWVTVDRVGLPLVNKILMPPQYNSTTTEQDAFGQVRPEMIQSLKAFATNDAHIEGILKLVQENGDFLRLDVVRVPNRGSGGGSNPDGGFGHNGGRRLQDDVVTETFSYINNGIRLTDNVLHDEQPFRNEFPFVADPNQPYPPGHEPDNTQQ